MMPEWNSQVLAKSLLPPPNPPRSGATDGGAAPLRMIRPRDHCYTAEMKDAKRIRSGADAVVSPDRTWTRRLRDGAALALLVASILAVAMPPAAPAVAQLPVDLELIFAVDASGSVDAREYALQTAGIAAAVRDPAVLSAIASGYHGRIGVALVTWADSAGPKDASRWFVIEDGASAERFANLAESFPLRVVGSTGIGGAIAFSARLFDRNGLASQRRVIDLSGDGSETAPRDYVVSPGQARFFALSRSVTVNGLAILNDEPELEAYYRAEIVIGPDAFTLAVATYEDFARAMRAKLLREIEYRPNMSDRGTPRRVAGRAP